MERRFVPLHEPACCVVYGIFSCRALQHWAELYLILDGTYQRLVLYPLSAGSGNRLMGVGGEAVATGGAVPTFVLVVMASVKVRW
jgi:hypothetical protein